MPISTPLGIKVLDGLLRGIYYEVPTAVHVRLWTVAPDSTGAGGTEVTGASVRPMFYSAAAQPGSAGRVAQAKAAQSLLFQDIDQPASAVVAVSWHDDVSGEMLWFAPWSPPAGEWVAGDSPSIPADNIILAFTA